MKTIIAGGRHYFLTNQDYLELEKIHAMHGISEVVCGCASGADSCGRAWAEANKIPVKPFPANWNRQGEIEYWALLAAMEVLGKNHAVRLVFWFDN